MTYSVDSENRVRLLKVAIPADSPGLKKQPETHENRSPEADNETEDELLKVISELEGAFDHFSKEGKGRWIKTADRLSRHAHAYFKKNKQSIPPEQRKTIKRLLKKMDTFSEDEKTEAERPLQILQDDISRKFFDEKGRLFVPLSSLTYEQASMYIRIKINRLNEENAYHEFLQNLVGKYHIDVRLVMLLMVTTALAERTLTLYLLYKSNAPIDLDNMKSFFGFQDTIHPSKEESVLGNAKGILEDVKHFPRKESGANPMIEALVKVLTKLLEKTIRDLEEIEEFLREKYEQIRIKKRSTNSFASKDNFLLTKL